MNYITKEEIIESLIEVETLTVDDFLKVKETLTRIGILSKPKEDDEKPTLWQSCHILHKRGKYYICHFKQLFLLDGRTRITNFTDEDLDRTEYIANLLENWGLIKIKTDLSNVKANVAIIPYAKKEEYNLKSKYTIGKKVKTND